jgi:hypothetical protein
MVAVAEATNLIKANQSESNTRRMSLCEGKAGLPDFSLYNIPKCVKSTKLPHNLPSSLKI